MSHYQMSKNIWYFKIEHDIGLIPDFIDYYENEMEEAKKEISMKGRLEITSTSLPILLEKRFSQLQDIEAVLEYLNILLDKTRSTHFKKFLEGYKRALSSRDADKYSEGEDEVTDMRILVNRVALIRNRFLSIMKALDAKSFQINNLVKLRVAGLEDIEI